MILQMTQCKRELVQLSHEGLDILFTFVSVIPLFKKNAGKCNFLRRSVISFVT